MTDSCLQAASPSGDIVYREDDAVVLSSRVGVRSYVGAVSNTIPNEMVLEIVKHCCAFPCETEECDPHLPLILGSVSRQWRQITHSTPSCWTRLGIRFMQPNPYAYASASALALLRTYFEKSGSLPVLLRISMPPAMGELQRGVDTMDIFNFIVCNRPDKLGALFIDDLPYSWMLDYALRERFRFGYDGLKLPALEQLNISMSEERLRLIQHELPNVQRILVGVMPRLIHLSLRRSVPPSSEFLYEGLITLELEEIPINECLQVIRKCTNIVNCFCRCPRPPSKKTPIPSTESIRLSRVKSFGWTFGYQRWDEALLQYVTLPALEGFQCEDQRPDLLISLNENPFSFKQQWHNLLSRFFHQSPNFHVFKSFAKEALYLEPRMLAHILPRHTQEIYLRHVDARATNALMCALTPSHSPGTPSTLLPCLKVLDLEIDQIYWIQYPVIHMLKERRASNLDNFGLEARLERLYLRRGQMGRAGGQMRLREDINDEFQRYVDDGLYLFMAAKNRGHFKWPRNVSFHPDTAVKPARRYPANVGFY